MPLHAHIPPSQPPEEFSMSAFVRAMLIRAARTVAQSLVAVIGAAVVLSDVDWVVAASTAAVAGLLSVLNSVITGLPEVPGDEPQA